MSSTKLSRSDSDELASFFREWNPSQGDIKAQNYEAFKTFSKDRGGVVDRDGEIIRRVDGGSTKALILRGRVLSIRDRMVALDASVGPRAWRTLARMFARPARPTKATPDLASKSALPPQPSSDLYGPPARAMRDGSRERHLTLVPSPTAHEEEQESGYALTDQFQSVFRSPTIARMVPVTRAAAERGERDWQRGVSRRAAKGDFTMERIRALERAMVDATGKGMSPFAVAQAVLDADESFRDTPTNAELYASVMRALDVATSKDARDNAFLTELRDQAVELMNEATAAWVAARESVDGIRAKYTGREELFEDLRLSAAE